MSLFKFSIKKANCKTLRSNNKNQKTKQEAKYFRAFLFPGPTRKLQDYLISYYNILTFNFQVERFVLNKENKTSPKEPSLPNQKGKKKMVNEKTNSSTKNNIRTSTPQGVSKKDPLLKEPQKTVKNDNDNDEDEGERNFATAIDIEQEDMTNYPDKLNLLKDNFVKNLSQQQNQIIQIMNQLEFLKTKVMMHINSEIKIKIEQVSKKSQEELKVWNNLKNKTILANEERIQQLEEELKKKDVEINRLNSELMENNQYKESQRIALSEIKLYNTELGKCLIEFFEKNDTQTLNQKDKIKEQTCEKESIEENKMEKQNSAFETFFQKRYPDFKPLSEAETLKELLEIKHNQKLSIKHITKVIQEHTDNLLEPINKNLAILEGLAPKKKVSEEQTSDSDIMLFREEIMPLIQENKVSTSKIIDLERDVKELTYKLELEKETNNRLNETTRLQSITTNNVMNQYHKIIGDNAKQLTWDDLKRYNEDVNPLDIGFDNVENWNYIELQNLMKELITLLNIPNERIKQSLIKISIVVKYEKNLMEYFINRINYRLHGESLPFKTYQAEAYKQFKANQSLDNLKHPLQAMLETLLEKVIPHL